MNIRKSQLHILRSFATFALALILAVSSAPMAYAADSGTCGESVTWNLSGTHLIITGKGEMTNFTDENMPPWYSDASTITKVTVGEGVTGIGALAFYGCERLVSVSLPASLTRIGVRAFKDCTALLYINFPAVTREIGTAAFENCASLSNIHLPEGLLRIDNYAFSRCSSLIAVTVPQSVRYFGSVVFAYCKNLTHATILCEFGELPDWTFYGCEKPRSVMLAETTGAAGEYAFQECGELRTIYYEGEHSATLMNSIYSDSENVNPTITVTDEIFENIVSGDNITVDENGATIFESTTITEKEDAVINTQQTTESTFEVNGEQATLEEVINAGEEAVLEMNSTTTTTINATITGSEGWNDLAEEVDKEIAVTDPQEDNTVKVIVRVPEDKISGDDLANLAGKDVKISIITPHSDVWILNGRKINADSVSEKAYDFGLTVSEVKASKTKIDSDTVFKLKFAKNVNFPVTVGVHVGHAYSMATLYEKNGSSYDELGTVIVDKSGTAWFTFDEIRKKTDYYVGINVAGKTEQEAVIPETLYSEYGLSDTIATLTDAEGNYYEVTGNKSSWGITAKQFGIYAGVAVALAVVIVTVVMFVMNKLKRNKDKYRAMALADAEAADEYDDDDDWEPIDEEALRLEIMRELLGEMDNNK